LTNLTAGADHLPNCAKGIVNLSIDKRNLMSFQEKSVSRKTIQDGAPDILPEVNLISFAAKLGDPRDLRAELSIIEKLKWINATRTQQHPDRRALRHYVE
jgi:hypothetical protein